MIITSQLAEQGMRLFAEMWISEMSRWRRLASLMRLSLLVQNKKRLIQFHLSSVKIRPLKNMLFNCVFL